MTNKCWLLVVCMCLPLVFRTKKNALKWIKIISFCPSFNFSFWIPKIVDVHRTGNGGRGGLCNYECEALLHVGGAKRASLFFFFPEVRTKNFGYIII